MVATFAGHSGSKGKGRK